MLIFVRHGRTSVNAAGRLQGRIDLPLDELGLRQAKAVAAAVGHVDRVISSPLVRARQTADAFHESFEVDERWIEMDYGIYDNLVQTDVPEVVRDKWRDNPAFAPEGGESFNDVAERVFPACEELIASAGDSDIVVVSHVSPMKVAVAWALGVGLEIAWRTQLSQASVCRVARGQRGPLLVSFNETPAATLT